MLIGEISRNSNIVLGFRLTEKHFDMPVNVIQNSDKKDKITLYTEPIIVHGMISRFSQKYEDISIKYHNNISNRTHIWDKNINVKYESDPWDYYKITCDEEDRLENRRAAIRIPINIASKCTISDLEGEYPCVIHDVSVYGIGINIDVRLMEKKLTHRLMVTTLHDDILDKTFYIRGNCIHTTEVELGVMRCGCEILDVYPSINEYINTRQTLAFMRATNYQYEVTR